MCNIKQLVTLMIFIVIVLSIGFLSGYITSTNITSWYQSLNHPIFSPPNWLFALVWSVIYIMIAFSAWLIFIQEKFKGKILYVFVIQLLLNFLWTFIFFGMHQILLALIEMTLLWFFILWSIKLFKVHSQVAAYLLIPYLLWVSFAWCLNFSYWWLN